LKSQAAIAILQGNGEVDHQHDVEVQPFRELLSRDWEVVIHHDYREANRSVNFLANRGHIFVLGSHTFPISNAAFGHLLLFDTLKISTPRTIMSIN
ncbi:hypothetical protein LINPERPRIM_LOCUS26341, partial [Linum perenne]